MDLRYTCSPTHGVSLSVVASRAPCFLSHSVRRLSSRSHEEGLHHPNACKVTLIFQAVGESRAFYTSQVHSSTLLNRMNGRHRLPLSAARWLAPRPVRVAHPVRWYVCLPAGYYTFPSSHEGGPRLNVSGRERHSMVPRTHPWVLTVQWLSVGPCPRRFSGCLHNANTRNINPHRLKD